MIGHLILLIGKTTSVQKGHLQSASLAETSSKNLGDTLVIYSNDYAFWILRFFFLFFFLNHSWFRLLSVSNPSSPLSCLPGIRRC